MKDAIRTHHPDWPSAATCNSSPDGKPINRLYITGGIDIQTGGYMPFDEGPPMDHRALWLDVSKRQIFGYIPPEIYSPRPKRLTIRDPRAVKKYNKRAKQELLRLKVPHQLFALEKEMQYPPTADEIWRYDLLPQTQHDTRKGAKRRCRKIKMGTDPWSPKLQVLRDTVLLWKLVIKKKRRRKVSS
jgi:hypothetical protein